MSEIPRPAETVSLLMESLLRRIREGEEAERQLIELLGSREAIVARLREEGALAANSRDLDTEAPLHDALSAWCEESAQRTGRFLDDASFWAWFSGKVRLARKSAFGQAMNDRRALAGLARNGHQEVPPSATLSRSISSSGLLIRNEMRAFESLFQQPEMNQGRDFFEDLCRTLFRVRIWLYVLRRRRYPNAARKDLLIKDSTLACLVYGFGLDQDVRKNQGRKIWNWLRPSMKEFNQYEDREFIRLIRSTSDGDPTR